MDPFAGQRARPRVCFQHLFYRFQLPNFRCRKDFSDHFRDMVETDTALQKRCYCHFIGGIECNCFCTPSLRRFIRETQTREFFHIRREEFEMS